MRSAISKKPLKSGVSALFSLEKAEQILYDTLALLGESLNKMVLVGGWCPFLYAKYLWKIPIGNIPSTTDIDLGVRETGSLRYNPTVYQRLVNQGYEMIPVFDDEPEPMDFAFKEDALSMKVEFLSSWDLTDDTIERFLGGKIACHRIEAFDILLENPTLELALPHPEKPITVRVPEPATYLYHKGITFSQRKNKDKLEKDLRYIFHVLEMCPDRNALIRKLAGWKGTDYFHMFQKNLKAYFGKAGAKGFDALRRQFTGIRDPRSLDREISAAFDPILELFTSDKGN